MNKKGISPLIGTVLLVAIVIAMVLLIMPWVSNLIKEQQERSTSALTKLDCIDELSFELLIDSADNLVISNTGQADIVSLKVRKYDIDGKLIESASVPGDIGTEAVLSYGDLTTGVSCGAGVERLEAVATIKSGGEMINCADNPRDIICY